VGAVFCRLGFEGDVPDHSTFSKTRHGRFRCDSCDGDKSDCCDLEEKHGCSLRRGTSCGERSSNAQSVQTYADIAELVAKESSNSPVGCTVRLSVPLKMRSPTLWRLSTIRRQGSDPSLPFLRGGSRVSRDLEAAVHQLISLPDSRPSRKAALMVELSRSPAASAGGELPFSNVGQQHLSQPMGISSGAVGAQHGIVPNFNFGAF
jgi:hypothetical protein